MGNKFDPLEAAKQVPLKQPKRSAAPTPPPQPAPVDSAPQAAVMADPVAAAIPLRYPPRYRVVTGKTVSMRGSITFLPPGKIISEGSYGPGIVALLREQNVEMEALPEGE